MAFFKKRYFRLVEQAFITQNNPFAENWTGTGNQQEIIDNELFQTIGHRKRKRLRTLVSRIVLEYNLKFLEATHFFFNAL